MASVNNEWKLILFCRLTEIYLQQKNYNEAQKSYRQMMNYHTPAIPMWLKLQMLLNQEKLLEFENDYKKALEIHQQINAMNDLFSSAHYSFELAAGQVSLENELLTQQLKIQQLENRKKWQTLEKARQTQRIIVLIIFLLVTVILIIGLQMRKIELQSFDLRQLNATKDRLFAIIGHDLRGPVINLQMSLTAIAYQTSDKSNPLAVSLSKQISRVNNLLSTLDNLLYWSITQQDKIASHKRPVVIASSVEDVLEWLEASIEEAEVHIHKNIGKQVQINVDENHFRIILRNLVHNAVKFTPKGGTITLKTKRIKDTVQLIIEDTGVGLSQSAHSPKQGTELGLKLVKELMSANQGLIDIGSPNGKGTTVILTFPLHSGDI